MMSFVTPTTSLSLRMVCSALSRSKGQLTRPESVTWPLSTSTWTALNESSSQEDCARGSRVHHPKRLAPGSVLPPFGPINYLSARQSSVKFAPSRVSICGRSFRPHARTDATKHCEQCASNESYSHLGRDGAGSGATGIHRSEQRNELQNLSPDTIADCAGDDVIELLLKPGQCGGARSTSDDSKPA